LLANALRCVRREASLLVFERCDHDPTTVALLIAYADVLQHAHEFGTAERAIDRVLGIDGTNKQARAMRASIRIARGRPLEALKDCTALIGADTLVATACIAQAISLNGRLAEAHLLLSTELSRTNAQGERTAWAFAILAELLERQGRYADAIAAMDRALSAHPTDAALRIQAADLMLRTDHPERVRKILERLPRVESVLLRHALAAKRTGAANADVLAREWRVGAERNTRFGRPAHLRDAAIAELHLNGRAREALRHAVANWNESKEIEDARILIAAAIAAGQAQAAAPALRWIDALDVEDAAIRRARARASI
jgi:tetratricopeptide (TPR) repeat protein